MRLRFWGGAVLESYLLVFKINFAEFIGRQFLVTLGMVVPEH